MDRNSRRSKGVGYVFYCQIISCSYVCAIVVLGYQHPRIMFNCIFKWTSNAIMMRDGGNTLHSCLINSCCTLKVDDIILVFCLVLFPIFFLCMSYNEDFICMLIPLLVYFPPFINWKPLVLVVGLGKVDMEEILLSFSISLPFFLE